MGVTLQPGALPNNVLQPSGVVPGSYSNANVVVNAQGIVVGISTGHPGIGSGVAISANGSSQAAGLVSFDNMGGVSFGMAGSTVTAAAPSFGTVIGSGTTFSGTNVSGSMTLDTDGLNLALSASAGGGGSVNFSAGASSNNLASIVFGDSNGLNWGLAGSTITASYTVPSVPPQTSLSFSNLNGVSFGVAGSTLTASVSQSVQPQSSLSFSNLNGVTFGVNASTLTASVAAQTSSSLSFSNLNGVSFGIAGSTLTASVTTYPAQTVQPIAVSGSNGSFAFSTLTLGDLNGLSFYSSNGSVVGSYTVPTQSVQTQASGAIAGTGFSYAGANVSGSGTLNTGGLSLSLSALAQSTQPVAVSGSNGSFTFSTLTMGNLNGLSHYTSNGSLVGSYTVPSVAGLLSAVNVSAGTTSSNLSAFTLSNSNGISFGLNASTITASYTVPSVAGLISAINVSAGTTSNNLSAFTLSNSNGISFGLNASTITASYTVPTQSAQTLSAIVSSNTVGNTSAMTFDARSLSFQAFGAASIGLSTTNTGASILFSAPVQTVQTQASGAIAGSGFSTGGANVSISGTLNSAGLSLSISGPTETGVGISAAGSSQSAGVVVFSNSNNVSFGMNGSTITATVTGVGGGGNTADTLYFAGNTTVSTSGTIAQSTYQIGASGALSAGWSNSSLLLSAPATSSLVGVNGISLSSNGSTISLSLIGTTNTYFEPGNIMGGSTTAAPAAGTLYLLPFELEQNHSFGRLQFLQQYSTQLTTTLSYSASVSAGNASSGTGNFGLLGTALLLSRLNTGGNSSQAITFFSNTFSYGVGMSNSVSWSTNVSSMTATITTSGAISFASQFNTAGGMTTGSFGTSGSSSFSASTTQASSFSSSLVATFASQVLSGVRPDIVPFGTSLTPGEYFLGLIFSTTSGSTNYPLSRNVAMGLPGIVYFSTNTQGYCEIGSTVSIASSNVKQGWGSYGTTANTTTTLALTAVSPMSQYALWFNALAASK